VILAVGPDWLTRNTRELSVKCRECLRLERVHPIIADHKARMEQIRLVDEVGCNQSGGERRTALDHQARDAAGGKKFQHRGQIELPCLLDDPYDLRARRLQDPFWRGRRIVAGYDQKRCVACRLY
jgi:hypothetical protein